MKLFKIWTPKFRSLLARDLTNAEIKQIVKIRNTMSFDDYAGYSRVEQEKLKKIQMIIGDKVVTPTEI